MGYLKRNIGFIVVLLISFAVLGGLIFGPTLVFGDTPLTDPNYSHTNFLYSWGPDSFGTTVRQGLYSLRNAIIQPFSVNEHGFYILTFLLPLIFIAPVYYLFLGKVGIRNTWAKVLGASLALINPVVFGDFSKAQSFWVYVTLPWVLYYLLKIFHERDVRVKNFLYLAIFSFASFGLLPPIILPMIMVYGLVAVCSLLFHRGGPASKLRFTLSLLPKVTLCAVLFIVMSLPYVLIAPAGQGAFKPVSLLGDYFHNYALMTLDNTFRLAGNEGNGLAVLGYNHFNMLNAVGLFVIIIIVTSFVLRNRSRNSLSLSLLIPILATLGFFHFLATNTDFGVAVFRAQFIASTIRDPTKIFEVILPVFVLAFVIGFIRLMKFAGNKSKLTLYLSTCATLLIYGWPIFTGNLGILVNRNGGIEAYKADKTVAKIVKDERGNNKRAIIIPSGHTDELNYQSTSNSLNTLRIGGALPNTTNIIQELTSDIKSKSIYTQAILKVTGINAVYVKTDKDTYFSRLFGLLDGVENDPVQTSKYFSSIYGKPKSSDSFQKFTNKDAEDMVTSPTKLAKVSDSATIHQIMPLIMRSNTVIQNDTVASSKQYDTYIPSNSLKDNEHIDDGIAQLFTNNIVELQYHTTFTDGSLKLIISRSDVLGGDPTLLVERAIDDRASQLVLDGQPYDLGTTIKTLALMPGNHDIGVGHEERLADPSQDLGFEQNAFVGDVSKTEKGPSTIESRLANDAVDGKHSLDVSTTNHVALVSKSFKTENSKIYKVQFEYKVLKGEAPKFGIYKGNSIVNDHLIDLDAQKGTWLQAETYIRSDNGINMLNVNMYVSPSGDEASEVLLDDIKIYQVDELPSEKMVVASYSEDYQLKGYINKTLAASKINMIDNGSFEDRKLWGVVGDSTLGRPGLAAFGAKQSKDAIDGMYSLELSSKNHTAYVRSGLRNFEPDNVYKVSLKSKHVKGGRAAVTVWQDGINRAADYKTLSANSEWDTYEFSFVPSPGTTNISVYLYSPSAGEETINRFDDVQINEQSLISNYLIHTKSASVVNSNIIEGYVQDSPTHLTLMAKEGTGLVKLNQSYHQGWRAFYVPSDYKGQNIFSFLTFRKPGIPAASNKHVLVDGYANGWLIDKAEIPPRFDNNKGYKIVLEYWPERQYMLTLFLSIFLTSGLLVYLVAMSLRDYNRKRSL